MSEQQATVVRDMWDEKAGEWATFAEDADTYWSRKLDAVYRLIVKNVSPGSSLDVGCGPGLLMRRLCEAGFDVHGADISSEMVKNAARALEGCVENPEQRVFHFADGGLSLDPAEHKYDLVSAIGVLEYITDRKTYVERLVQYIKPGGYLALANTNRFCLFILLSVPSRILRPYPKKQWYQTIRNLACTGLWSGGHVDIKNATNTYSAEALDTLAASNGLELVDYADMYYFCRWLDRAPTARKGLGRKLARRWGWNHLAIYRKPAST